ncbi:MAG: phosphate/phosphite/phosphonate ABC transporter substrate-binding protein [Pseudomonadota bacterium]
MEIAMRSTGRNILVALAVLALSALTFFPVIAEAAGRKTYVFAVLPQQPPASMHALWIPLVERLERELGITIRLKLYDSMSGFEDGLKRGAGDFIFSTPPQMVIARSSQKYIPLVRGNRELAGVLFVRKDSPIKSIADLKATEIAFVGERNLCSVMTRYSLSQYNTDLNLVPLFSGSTTNVYRNVLLGKVAAGATLDVDIERENPETVAQLRVIMTTPKVAPHPVSAHPRVPKALREKMTATLLKLSKQKEGMELLKQVRIGEVVPADYARDYKNLEKIGAAR